MRKMIKMSMAAVMMMGVGAVSVQAEGTDILSNIKANGQVRARYEMVDADDAANLSNANAFTNRLTLGISADLLGTSWLSAYAEMTDVRALNDNYNDMSINTGNELHDNVKDPEQTRLTQAYIDLKYGKTKLRVGRQAINLDNIRFVGTVDWRQMPQTFDAYTLTDNTIENLNLFASYVSQINGIGDDSLDAEIKDTRTLLLNASYKVMPELKVTVYDYMIGAGTNGHVSGSDTYGAALTGDIAVSDALKLNYRAEYAKQTDATMENSGVTSTTDVDADYMNFELGANMSGFLVGAQYEVLSGDSDGAGEEKAFATPLATLHAHNGWADVFLTTPNAGLEDMSAMVGYTSKDLGTLKVVYHDFQSDVGSTDYGTEVDAVYTRAVPGVNGLVGTLKVADYDAETNTGVGAVNTDVTKFWAMLDYKFSTK